MIPVRLAGIATIYKERDYYERTVGRVGSRSYYRGSMVLWTVQLA